MTERLKQLWEFVELVKRCRAAEKRMLANPNDHQLRLEVRDWRRRIDAALRDLTGSPTLFDGGDAA